MIGKGEVLARRYELKDDLGSGGMGTVWRATDRQRRREVAVKVLAEHLSKDPAAVKRFQREARVLTRLSHPNIVPIHDSGVDRGRHFIVMELIEGISVFELLCREGSIAPGTAASIGVQVCEALEYAHDRGVIHRDVKPGNLMIVEGEETLVKVTDFGIARLLDETAVTATDSIVGSIPYLAPEQVRGGAPIRATDIYALGVVLYECIASRRPYEAGSLQELMTQQQRGSPPALSDRVGGVDPALSEAIMRALELDPGRRHPSAGEFGLALDRFTGSAGTAPTLPIEVRGSGAAARGRPHGVLAILAVVALALLGILLLVATEDGGQAPEMGQRDRPQPDPEDGRDGGEPPPEPEEEPVASPKGEEPTEETPESTEDVIRRRDRSRYSEGGYNAELLAVTRGPQGFDVRFVARGAPDLRRPESSCVEVAGQQIAPDDVRLTVDQPGFYEGTLGFPYGAAGAYRFRYSCRRDYSAPFLFDRSKGTSPLRTLAGPVGTSQYGPDPHYRAVVGPVEIYPSSFVVEFESNGYSDLRHPRESCVKHGGDTIRPIGLRLDTELDTRYRGEMTFPYEGPGMYEFLYSCQPDYSLVLLFSD